MQILPKEPYRRAVYLVFYIILGLCTVYVAFRYLFPLMLPFILAFAAATLLRRPTLWMASKLKMPPRIVAVLLVLIFMTIVIGIAFLGITVAVEQLAALAGNLMNGETTIVSDITAFFDKISDFLAGLPFFSDADTTPIREKIGEALLDVFKSTLVAITTKIPDFIGRLISFVPQALVFSVVTIFSAIYFCADYEKIIGFVKSRLSGRPLAAVRTMYGQTGHTLMKYLKSYTVIFLFTFAELFVGFTVLRERYAFLLALVTAVVDILPVLGTGTVLIPWSVYLFIAGDPRRAVGLLILYAVISVLRQILEPRIVGAGIGLSPILALMSMYVGLRLFGFFGMLLLPLAVVIIKNTIEVIRRSAGKEKIKEEPS